MFAVPKLTEAELGEVQEVQIALWDDVRTISRVNVQIRMPADPSSIHSFYPWPKESGKYSPQSDQSNIINS